MDTSLMINQLETSWTRSSSVVVMTLVEREEKIAVIRGRTRSLTMSENVENN